jgi:hypothetical protein
VITDPHDKAAVYVFAVNHPPNPDYPGSSKEHAASRVEIFRHVLGSSTITHLRTVLHPLITTPNDVYAEAPDSFFVTNDHFYRDGPARTVEDVFPAAKWSNTRHVHVTDLHSANASAAVTITTAIDKVHNCNGLGHSPSADEVLLISASSGRFYRTTKSRNNHPTLTIEDIVQLNSTLDNPSWYTDPYATPSDDASGAVLAGLGNAASLPQHRTDPHAKDSVMVWHVRPRPGTGKGSSPREWDIRLLFEDDGSIIRSSSAAVLIAIDPKLEHGQKKAWLFVTGFLSANMIAVKVSL